MGMSEREAREAFEKSLKVDTSGFQKIYEKRAQVSSNNASNNTCRGEDIQRQRSLEGGRGNER